MDLLDRTRIQKAAELLQAVADYPRPHRNDGPKLRLGRLFCDLSRGHVHGEDREAIQEIALQHGIKNPDGQRPFIPFSEFRDLSKASAGAGGFLVSAEVPDPAVDILRPWSIAARAGIMIETGLIGDQTVPKVTVKSAPYWLTNESTAVTASQPTLSQIPLTPKTVGGLVAFSRQLALQANAENFVRRELMRTIGMAIDQAILNGSGAAGQPTGLLLTAGVQSQTGTSLSQTGVATMKKLVAEANAPDEAISFLSTPAIRLLLESRERATTGSGFIWDRDMVASRPANVSTDVPTATMICGAWPAIYLGIWGQGFVVEIDPSTGFKSAVLSARLLLSCDAAITQPTAFCVASSIT